MIKKENIVHLLPIIKAKKSVNIVTYFPGNKMVQLKKDNPYIFNYLTPMEQQID